MLSRPRSARRLTLGTLLALAGCLAGTEPATDPFLFLAPGWVTVEPGDSARLWLVRVTGDTLPSATVAWSSSNPAVADVDQAGVVSGKAVGLAVIRGSAEGRNARATIVVSPPVLVGAGDIGACGSTGVGETGRLLEQTQGIVFTTGDNAYPDGTLLDYEHCYDPSWGRHRARTRPAPGNHDYHTPGGRGYFQYFGLNAGDPTKGYYSYDLGDWHVVVLNTSIPFESGSVQVAWLRNDLAGHTTPCAAAYWHHPRFSSGFTGSDARLQAIWQILYDGGVDVAIAGHDHNYERFTPQRADGAVDTADGVRQFVVGTGGGDFFPMGTVAPNSEVRIANTFGLLRLSLSTTSYSWQFLRAPGGAVLDSGTTACH